MQNDLHEMQNTYASDAECSIAFRMPCRSICTRCISRDQMSRARLKMSWLKMSWLGRTLSWRSKRLSAVAHQAVTASVR